MSGSRILTINSRKYGTIDVKYSSEDAELVLKNTWHAQTYTKGSFRIANSKKKYLHRLILGIINPHISVDHIDMDPLNNTRENLRSCSHTENNCNRSKQSNNKSGHKGVSWDKENSKWVAHISYNKKCLNLGRFRDIHDAIAAYAIATEKYHKEFARTE